MGLHFAANAEILPKQCNFMEGNLENCVKKTFLCNIIYFFIAFCIFRVLTQEIIFYKILTVYILTQ